jgi:hypothetical protein
MIAPGIRVVRGPDWIWQNQGKIHTDMLLISQRSVIYIIYVCSGLFLEVHFPLCCYQYVQYINLFIFYYFHSARVNKGTKLTVKTILFLCVCWMAIHRAMRIKSVNNQIYSSIFCFINRTDILGLLVIYIINMI